MEPINTGIADVILRPLQIFTDRRGWLGEFFRMDELDHGPSMAYLSMTLPGVARGPHEHRLQTDLFVFAGPGLFTVYLYDNRPESPTYRAAYHGDFGEGSPASLLVPPRVIHAYRCISQGPGLIANLPDKLYKGAGRREAIDEIRHEDHPGSPFYSVFDSRLFMGHEAPGHTA